MLGHPLWLEQLSSSEGGTSGGRSPTILEKKQNQKEVKNRKSPTIQEEEKVLTEISRDCVRERSNHLQPEGGGRPGHKGLPRYPSCLFFPF